MAKLDAMNENVICVPVSKTFHLVESLGIYCMRYDKTYQEETVKFLMPRISAIQTECRGFLENKGYNVSYDSVNNKVGLCWCLYVIKDGKSIQSDQCSDPEILEKIKIWKKKDPDRAKYARKNYKVFVLEKQIIFKDLRKTQSRNSTNSPYYTVSEDILLTTELKLKCSDPPKTRSVLTAIPHNPKPSAGKTKMVSKTTKGKRGRPPKNKADIVTP